MIRTFGSDVGWVFLCVLVSPVALLCSCTAPSGDAMEKGTLASASQALESSFTDDSASPVHIQVKVCTTETPAEYQTVRCQLDTGYALVGGGAYAQWSSWGALLYESFPYDGRTWQASSKDHYKVDMHNLSVYAIGMRLDGVNSAVLRSLVQFVAAQSAQGETPSTSVVGGARMISGGAQATWPGQLLTKSVSTGSGSGSSWAAASKDHIQASLGTVTAYATRLTGYGLIEGFGYLDIQQNSGPTNNVTNGVGSSQGTVDSGWALAGYGGSTTSSGWGRMLFRMGMDSSIRTVIAQSKDHVYASSGTTTAVWSQVRHRANSHGMCSTGAPLSADMDTCVQTVCTNDPYCCNTAWDDTCVQEIPTYCGISCAHDTCTLPHYQPSYWLDPNYSSGNCYNYATNTPGVDTQPGEGSGAVAPNVCQVARYAQFDGLISIPDNGTCPDNRARIALILRSNQPGCPASNPGGDYHWIREDTDPNAGQRLWSHKPGPGVPPQQEDYGDPAQLITDPKATLLAGGFSPYDTWVGYFCACSSSTELGGHSDI